MSILYLGSDCAKFLVLFYKTGMDAGSMPVKYCYL